MLAPSDVRNAGAAPAGTSLTLIVMVFAATGSTTSMSLITMSCSERFVMMTSSQVSWKSKMAALPQMTLLGIPPNSSVSNRAVLPSS